ncbi:MAG: lipoate--protein ligase [Cellulosilyticaceae bacterium]
MNKIVISKVHNPYFNLALEEQLFRTVEESQVILYLWQNDNTVVIGNNQNPWLECDMEAIEKHNISLARRLSGGGAVYHDLGNLNFTFITKAKAQNLSKQLKVICKALEFFGLKVTQTGRNDLLIGDKKFSGHAFYEEDDRYFHHGTLMVDVDLQMLEKVLKPSKLKLESKGIDSVKSRVINLKCIEKNITITSLMDQLSTQFQALYGAIEVVVADNKTVLPQLSQYQSKKWIMGESPKFDAIVEKKIEGIGNIQVAMTVEDGVVRNARVYSDTLGKIDFRVVEQTLIGLNFSPKQIEELLMVHVK